MAEVLQVYNPELQIKFDYWRTRLKHAQPVQIPKIDNQESERCIVDQKIGSTSEIEALGAQTGKEPLVLWITLIEILLYRYSNQEEFVFVALLQPHEAVVVRSPVSGTVKFKLLPDQIEDSLRKARKFPLSFDELALFFNENQQLNKPSFFIDLTGNAGNVDLNFPLSFRVLLVEDQYQMSIRYLPEIYDGFIMQQMPAHFSRLVESISKLPDEIIGALPIITDEEIDKNIVQFNATLVSYPLDKTVVDFFELKVAEAPERIALLFEDEQMSYGGLNEYANRLAHFLLAQGVVPGDNIGLVASRGFHMIAAMLGILKAGGAYVPIEPEYPLERQSYILKQAGAKYIVCDTEYPVSGSLPEMQFLNLEKIDIDDLSIQNPGLKIDTRQLAYTIFTSGSTGTPKGVMIEHHSVLNLVLWVNNTFAVNETDRLLFITSMCFDLSVYDIFGMLAAGGSIVIVGGHDVFNVNRLPELIGQLGITFWDSVPTTLDFVTRSLERNGTFPTFPTLRLVFLSGDWIPVNLPLRIKSYFPNASTISLGGATEGTVWSNYYPIGKVNRNWKSIPYGKPIANNKFYILNEQLQPVPTGIAGELFIGGVGVARGYAGDSVKTATAFLPDPFDPQPGAMMYRTGDLGRMLQDGNMEFIGRKDTQVKIRGYRVELGEIESLIHKTSMTTQATVIAAKGADGLNRLVVYYVPGSALDKEILIDALKAHLPEYMVPSVWVKMDKLPLNSNGKIDRKALPDPDLKPAAEQEKAPPRTTTEIGMVEIWKEVLNIREIGIDDNFFELGGQSLLAVSISNDVETKLHKKFDIYSLFKYPTIRKLSAYIDAEHSKQKEKSYTSLVAIKTTGNKTPVYLVHGDGFNVANFGNLAAHIDPEQPLYTLQPHGHLPGDEPFDDMTAIARHYVDEMLMHNPDGPYAVVGYSFGGYVAAEMYKILVERNKKVCLLGIFDTNAENTEYNKPFLQRLPKKIKRQLPKLLFFMKQFARNPKEVIDYQALLIKKKIHRQDEAPAPMNDLEKRMHRIDEKHRIAFHHYLLTPFDGAVVLFRAAKRIYFVDDLKYLGWKKYAQRGVKVYDVPGDHKTMFLEPNVKTLAKALQDALDAKCGRH